jgi:hypothetical protein
MAVTSLKLFEPFFGGDQKGGFFVQALYNGTDYTDAQPSGLMHELLRSDNYINTKSIRAANGMAQGPEDVHQDVTDLIITTALFHSSIDNPTDIGSTARTAVDEITKNLTNFFYVKNPANVSDWDEKTAYTNAANNEIRQIYAHIPVNDTRAKWLIDVLADRAAYALQYNDIGGFDEYTTNDCHALNTNTILEKISSVQGLGHAQHSLYVTGINPVVNQYYIVGTDTVYPGLIKNQLINIYQLIKTELNREYPFFRVGTPAQRTADMTGPGLACPQARNAVNAANLYSTDTIKSFLSIDRINKYLNALYKGIVDGLKDMVKNINQNRNMAGVLGDAVRQYTTLGAANVTARKFFNEVYSKWPNMPSELRDFYGQNVAIFTKSAVTPTLYKVENDPNRRQYDPLQWIKLTRSEVDALFSRPKTSPITDTEYGDMRINLMKAKKSGYKDVLLGYNLPALTGGTNVWYTQANSVINCVQAVSPDFLKQLYFTVYNDKRPLVPFMNFNIPTALITPHNPIFDRTLDNINIDINTRPLKPFALNYGKFTEAALRHEDALMTQSITVNQTGKPDGTLDSFDILTSYDNVYGIKWSFDPERKQHYRNDDVNNPTKRVYYDDAAKGDSKTCYASYLAKGSDEGCIRILNCLATGDTKSLNRCLDVIGDGELWDVVADDVSKVGPDMIRLVFRKFGINTVPETDENGNTYKVPISYETWLATVVESLPDIVLKQTLKKNDKLLNYVSRLIDVCKKSPTILNGNMPAIIPKDNTPQIFKNLGVPRYRRYGNVGNNSIALENIKNGLKEAMGQYASIATPGPGFFRFILNGGYSNGVFVNPYTAQLPSLFGGGLYRSKVSSQHGGLDPNQMKLQSTRLHPSSASSFTALLEGITGALHSVGIEMHSDDNAKIQSALIKLSKYEDQFARLCTVLIATVKLARFFGITLEHVDKNKLKPLKLSGMKSMAEVTNFIKSHANNLVTAMSQNMQIQRSVGNEFMSNVAPSMLDGVFP